MRLGLFMMPLHPPQRPMHETLAEDTEKSLLADRLGFDELWVGEHFSATSEPIASPLMFMAGLIHRTRLAFGTGVINLPNHHPAIVAAEVAQFDHMSGGRLMLGIGSGGLASDFELFGDIAPIERGKRMLESIAAIQAIWAADPPYEIDGATWPIRLTRTVLPDYGVGFMPKPFRREGPSIHISARQPDSYGVTVAAARGWGVISANFVAHRVLGGHWRGIAKGLAEAGRPVDGSNWRVARNLVIAANDTEARARATAPEGATRYYFDYLGSLAKRAGLAATMTPRDDMDPMDATTEDMIEACVICGSPKTVLDRLVALREDTGPFGHLLMPGLDWSGVNASWEAETMKRLAEEVMPRLRQHVEATARAAE
ncbi:LLM class flavin-dependent oxidoreductase [Roseomonas eburnea]|uniref:LLM class flavin-dependent oxidoreductase n=1 Tax=Neoroseomonas eburnea TaxID=1346889 RepID=A0A9X9X8S1_9PROT|nr:LLM class flavin-dependent oxidoreductase [Neoroseomonas eburnea]MBR0680107.1 LLM class flavin-dependent oxidoreductase [Neoroseomonas eburnea]